MSESDLTAQKRPPATSVLFILLATFAGFIVIGPSLGFLIALPFFDGSLLELTAQVSNPILYPQVKIPALIVQGSATFFGLIMVPSLYWFGVEKQNVLMLVRLKSARPALLALVAILVVLFMAPNSVIIDWNAHISLPDFMQTFENAAHHLEDQAEQLTRFFTTFDSGAQFIFVFFIVAVFPAIGEELVFRGMLQVKVQQATGSAHLGIWISAVLFSAIHLQFFGFVPRVFLGALFGYLYLWSGNLLIPVFAHFVNNGFSVILIYLQQLGKLDIHVDGTDRAPWSVVIVGLLLAGGLLIFLKKVFQRNLLSSSAR